MKFNPKVIFLGGLVFYVAQFAVGLVTGQVIHTNILETLYQAHQDFWRPELNQDPPDMAALMPRWIAVGLVGSFVLAAIYDNIRGAFNGSAVLKGVKFGVVLTLIFATIAAGWSGIFNLPNAIWFWWVVDGAAFYLVGGAVLGWFTGRFAAG